jgi:hypothetical protein
VEERQEGRRNVVLKRGLENMVGVVPFNFTRGLEYDIALCEEVASGSVTADRKGCCVKACVAGRIIERGFNVERLCCQASTTMVVLDASLQKKRKGRRHEHSKAAHGRRIAPNLPEATVALAAAAEVAFMNAASRCSLVDRFGPGAAEASSADFSCRLTERNI